MLSRGESCWLGIHIVRPDSRQKASYCAEASQNPAMLQEKDRLLGVLRLSGSPLFSVSKPVA